jgi:site-specific recombinase XerD
VVAKTIRHTMATELRKHGVPEADIQGMLGQPIMRTNYFSRVL